MSDNNISYQPDTILKKEDYAEPACLLCGKPFGQEDFKPVPLSRILEKMDEYMGRQDFAGAERLLTYWLSEAELGGDKRGMFSLHNELMGYYRKMGRKELAFSHAEAALALIGSLGLEGSPSAGTCYVNSGTVFAAFDEPERSVPYFEKARAIYEEYLDRDDSRLGALYNNMGLTFGTLDRFAEAHAVYQKALDVMKNVPNGCLEMAITYLNDADIYEAEALAGSSDIAGLFTDGAESGPTEGDAAPFFENAAPAVDPERAEEIIRDRLAKAKVCLENPAPPRDGYYAFVCEKCAPAFTYYGWSAYGDVLKARAESIYSSNRRTL